MNWVCLAAAILPGVLAMLLLGTFAAQIRSMYPQLVPPEENQRLGRFVDAALEAHGRARIAHAGITMAHHQPAAVPGFEPFTRRDPGNGLYAHLALLDQLRQVPPTATQPADLARVAAQIRATATAPPARLYHRAVQEAIATSLVERGGLDAREAEAHALRWIAVGFHAQHRPVVRALVDELLRVAAQLRTANQTGDALAADLAGARLITQLLEDSPTFDVALLASEQLPRVLQAAAQDAATLNLPGADDATTAADAAAHFATAWHAAYTGEVNLLPFSGNIPADIAAPAQRRLLRVFSAAAVTMAAWGLLWVMLLVVALTAKMWSLSGQPLLRTAWRGSDWLGGVIVLAPLLTLLIALRWSNLSFTWLYTLNSVYALILFTPVWLVTLAVAATVTLRPIDPAAATHWPRWSPLVLLTAVLLPVVMALLILPVSPSSPRGLPAAAQVIRRPLVFTGLASAAAIIIWFSIGQLRRRSHGLPAGLRARAQVVVLSRALPLAALLMLILLALNARADRDHQSAYAAAARDPVADKLDADWQQHYFGPAVQVIQMWHEPPAGQRHSAAGPVLAWLAG